MVSNSWPETSASFARDTSALALVEYFRCPAESAALVSSESRSSEAGFFRVGDVMAYGRTACLRPSPVATGRLPDLSGAVLVQGGAACLPFDLGEAVGNLREERYPKDDPGSWWNTIAAAAPTRAGYYCLRPLLPVRVRKHLQKLRFSGWRQIAFPRWPVDVSVDALQRRALAAAIRASGVRRLPFVWFWPEGKSACAIVTHDVEGPSGLRFCPDLMDLDDAFGIRSSFQLVPERHGRHGARVVRLLRSRGFEVNIHDLRHDGYLFSDRKRFRRRAARVNAYARALGARGFRSGAMYRQQAWYDLLEISYDMSVPNVAHLEPQRGGCCTVMPYFVGNILELPLTTVEDYTLFHILGEFSTALWKQQIHQVVEYHGLVTLLAHPDYLAMPRAAAVYRRLLQHVAHLRDTGSLWVALPAEVDRWWRDRRAMRLVRAGRAWRVEGAGSERARVAYASLRGDRLMFEVDNTVFPQ